MAADVSFSHHDQVPIEVVGVLERTGTPVDNALFVNLETIEAIHADEEEHEHEEAITTSMNEELIVKGR